MSYNFKCMNNIPQSKTPQNIVGGGVTLRDKIKAYQSLEKALGKSKSEMSVVEKEIEKLENY